MLLTEKVKIYEASRSLAGDVFHTNVFIMLSGIVAELEPEHIYRLLHVTAADDDVFVMDRFRAAGQNAVAISVAAILDQNTLILAVFGKIFCAYTLAALQYNGIVVDVKPTALDQHVGADVNIDSV